MATSTTILKFFMGRRGDVISRLPNGKIVLPARGFEPRLGEEWEVEIIQEKERVAIARPIRRVSSPDIWSGQRIKRMAQQGWRFTTDQRALLKNIEDIEFLDVSKISDDEEFRFIETDNWHKVIVLKRL